MQSPKPFDLTVTVVYRHRKTSGTDKSAGKDQHISLLLPQEKRVKEHPNFFIFLVVKLFIEPSNLAPRGPNIDKNN